MKPVEAMTVIEHTHMTPKAKHTPMDIKRRVVFVGTCTNCDHLPTRVNKLMTLMSLMVAILAGIVVYQSPELATTVQFVSDHSSVAIEALLALR